MACGFSAHGFQRGQRAGVQAGKCASDVFPEDADAKGWSDTASSAKGRSLDKTWHKRGMAGVFSALRLHGFCVLLSKAHTYLALHNMVNFIVVLFGDSHLAQ